MRLASLPNILAIFEEGRECLWPRRATYTITDTLSLSLTLSSSYHTHHFQVCLYGGRIVVDDDVGSGFSLDGGGGGDGDSGDDGQRQSSIRKDQDHFQRWQDD